MGLQVVQIFKWRVWGICMSRKNNEMINSDLKSQKRAHVMKIVIGRRRQQKNLKANVKGEWIGVN